jgi:hypothetical protein
MNFRIFATLLIVPFLSHDIAAQISIQFPTERAIFQRDLNNSGTIYISGTIDKQVDKVEARLLEYKAGGLTEFMDWQVMDNQSIKGSFSGTIKTKGGWYKLFVRCIIGDNVSSLTVLNKVGIGEVFVISGQSNAQGVPNTGGVGAKDDRVNCANFTSDNYSLNPKTDLMFSQLGNNVNIGPLGLTPWCWGQLGDSLAKKLDVPIMFFNAALSRTQSSNWYESSIGIPTKDAIFQGYFEPGFPYAYLKNTLKLYASLYGVRTILWHQGETDTFPGVPVENAMFGFYEGLINNTRKDFGYNISWMFSKVSYVDGRTSSEVLNAQQRIIEKPNFNIFEGPSTDKLMIPRFDEVHFGNNTNVQGLEILALAWLEKLNTSFFSNSKPVQTEPLVELKLGCFENSKAKIEPLAGYTVHAWSNGKTDPFQLASSGTIGALLKDNIGNSKVGKALSMNAITFKSPEVISDKTFICENEKLVLNAKLDYPNLVWNTSEKTKAIEVTKEGDYSYSFNNTIGCTIKSEPILVKYIGTPDYAKNPFIEINGQKASQNEVFGFCDGQKVTLKANNSFNSIEWSDGSKEVSRSVTETTNLFFKGLYGPGCLSAISPIIQLNKNAKPTQPRISENGRFEISLENNSKHDFYRWKVNGQIVNHNTATIKINQTGDYQLIVIDLLEGKTECLSEPSNIIRGEYYTEHISIAYPNPTKYVIYLESSLEQTNVKIRLVNSEGKIVKILPNLNSWINKITIPVSDVATGVYILFLESDQTILRKKISIL